MRNKNRKNCLSIHLNFLNFHLDFNLNFSLPKLSTSLNQNTHSPFIAFWLTLWTMLSLSKKANRLSFKQTFVKRYQIFKFLSNSYEETGSKKNRQGCSTLHFLQESAYQTASGFESLELAGELTRMIGCRIRRRIGYRPIHAG